MPRYIVQRTFPDGLLLPIDASGEAVANRTVANNMEERVTWMQSFVSDDKRTTFCVYDGPSPEAVRRAAQRNGLPVDRVTEVRVLDPYFYR
jgi:hypothetical protein